MVDFKLVIATKDGKSHQREVKEPNSRKFMGMKIGDTLKGENIDLTGYEFLVTGGSDFLRISYEERCYGNWKKKNFDYQRYWIEKKLGEV